MLRVIAENRSLSPHSYMHMKTDRDGFPRCVPEPWRRHGHFWYTAQLLSFMLQRPNPHFSMILKDAKVGPGSTSNASKVDHILHESPWIRMCFSRFRLVGEG